MRLRVRSSQGVSELQIDPSVTFGSLKAQLGASSSPFSVPTLQVRCGFPPKQLSAADEQPVSTILSNGDVLVVQSTPGTALQPQRSKTSNSNENPSETSQPPSSDISSSILSNGPLVIREVPDDNSCLFRSVNALLGHPSRSPTLLRTVVKDAVAAKPDLYNEGFLGRSNTEYQYWIMGDNSWGGAIELSILAVKYKLELATFDIKTMRLDKYGEGNNFSTAGFLIYDGIHYNYVALALGNAPASQGMDVTQFEAHDKLVHEKVQQLAQTQHDARKYTDTANANFKCGQCGSLLTGERGVADHAKTTGHSQFSES